MIKYTKVADIRMGEDIHFDAWLYTLMLENNFNHEINPTLIASREQIKFMVTLDEKQVYLPCSDQCFSLFLNTSTHKELQTIYNNVFKVITAFIKDIEPNPAEREKLLTFCKQRFENHKKNYTILPSRLIKRLTSLVFALMKIDNCWIEQKNMANLKSLEILQSAQIQNLLNATPKNYDISSIVSIRNELNFIEVARTMYLSALSSQILKSLPSEDTLSNSFDEAFELAKPIRPLLENNKHIGKIILFLCDTDGGIIFDLKLLSCLITMGHKVILALKHSFYFNSPTMDDLESDISLKEANSKATVIHNPNISKNALLEAIDGSQMIIISDGTRERLNLYRASTTFARAWKECDLVLTKGWRNEELLMQTSHEFTRDIICYNIDDENNYKIQFKKHSDKAFKHSRDYILAKAQEIIDGMHEAKLQGKSIMFYSCVIGSIPGQTDVAISLVQAFIKDLRFNLPNAHIVNPTEYFEEGFDGDDLMFMWEKVQRSGYINIWRFQTISDIEKSFALLYLKMPTIWLGKDSTFSTGCTKEMHIAVSVQKKFKEMQIIGPSPEMFFRRSEYGIGKYHDADIC